MPTNGLRRGGWTAGLLFLGMPALAQTTAMEQLEAAAPAGAVTAPQVAAVPGRSSRSYDVYDGREEAARACSAAAFDSDKRECLVVVARADYFDGAAARACGRLSFSSNVPKCIEAVADKDYLPSEVDVCAGSSFDSSVVSCLKAAGRPHSHRPPYPYPYPDRPRRSDASCYAFDRGWEEHWGGHGGYRWDPGRACQECLQRHGGCNYRCTIESWRCTAEWVPSDASQPRRTYEGRPDRDRWDAEREALLYCRDIHWGDSGRGDCRVLNCRREDELVDSGSCRR
ncbi:MAG: hypothetical protein HY748_11445 [Elusimicrobia bacterium]|nr:hypothetical protein [Elusimicrobiota bacterium]